MRIPFVKFSDAALTVTVPFIFVRGASIISGTATVFCFFCGSIWFDCTERGCFFILV